MQADLLSPDLLSLPPLDSPPLNEPAIPNMEGYDAMPMFPMPLEDGTTPGYDTGIVHTIDPDQLSNFDGSQYGGSDYNPTPMLSRPTLKRAHTSMDDQLSNYDAGNDSGSVADQPVHDSPQLDRDDKNLFFTIPSYNVRLLDYTYRPCSVAITSQLNGMFFLTDKSITSSPTTPTPAVELTCYRRNLFSITGTISVPRSLRYILTEQGEQIPIVGQDLVLSATESVEGNPVKIISVPWKTPPQATTSVPEDNKPEKEPTSLPLDLMAGNESDPDIATFPIAWKRLQFRIATANNGRRKELQQHFVIKLKLMATLSNGQRMSLAEVTSNNIIVRGRSPRNFQQKKEAPTSAGALNKRAKLSHAGSTHTSPVPQMRTSDDLFQFDPRQTLSMSPDPFDWRVGPAHNGAMTALPPDTFHMPVGVNMYANSSPDLSRRPRAPPTSMPQGPINLSLVDDEPKKPFSPVKKVVRAPTLNHTGRAPSFGLSSLTENDETADLLYEYFPLGLDDWHEPVDAVYRPHVVHHIAVPDQIGKPGMDRSKRYFSSEQQRV